MVRRMLLSSAMVCALVMIFIGAPSLARSESPDNTKMNKQERSQGEISADQQGQSKQDVETTRKIRQTIVKDKSLSTDAHNIKIVTMDGKVTLKGPVKSEEEKKTIEEKAAQVAGKDKIKNEITVAPKKEARNK